MDDLARAERLLEGMADKWDMVAMQGGFPKFIMLRYEDEAFLRCWQRIAPDKPATFRTTQILAVRPGDVFQFGRLVICRSEDVPSVQGMIAQRDDMYQIGELPAGECWVMAQAQSQRSIGETG